jgi:hypothetical protein
MSEESFGYDSRLPEDICEIFMWLCQDIASLQSKWSFYLELFSSQENVTLLSDMAPSSFQIIEESLRSDLMISICRLSDPDKSLGKDNLSFKTLIIKCNKIDKVDKLLEDFLDACKPVQKYRNKRVAHNDLNTRIKPHETPLPGISRHQIDKILQLASQVLNVIYQEFIKTGELSFQANESGGADSLIYWLRMAKKCVDEKKKGLRN